MFTLNSHTFNLKLERYGKFTDQQLRTITRKVGLVALSQLVDKSPVKTGRFKSTWDIAIGDPPQLNLEIKPPTEDETYPSPRETIEKGYAKINKYPNKGPLLIISLYNNLPYATRLEGGYSRQAPLGIVKPTKNKLHVWIKSKT